MGILTNKLLNTVHKINRNSEWKIYCTGAIPIDPYFEKIGFADVYFQLNPELEKEIESSLTEEEKNMAKTAFQKTVAFINNLVEEPLAEKFEYTYSIHIPFQRKHYLGKIRPFFIDKIEDIENRKYVIDGVEYKYTREWKEKMLDSYYLQYDMHGGDFSMILVVPTHGVVLA